MKLSRAEPRFGIWRCEECGYEDPDRAFPKDRVTFYDKVSRIGSPKCPSCKSVGFMPVGF